MNRRDALKVLSTLPETARLSIARPAADDVIVIECPATMRPYTPEQVDQLRTQIERVWPGRTAVVLPPGLHLVFARRDEVPSS